MKGQAKTMCSDYDLMAGICVPRAEDPSDRQILVSIPIINNTILYINRIGGMHHGFSCHFIDTEQ